MDVGKSFTYVFEDEQWVSKVLMGALFSVLSFALIGIPFIVGYTVELVANVRKGEEKPLPAWDNLGKIFRDGLLLIIGFLIYLLPIWILTCPFIVLTSSFDGSSAEASNFITVIGFTCLVTIWGLVVAILSPAIYIRFAETRELGAIFRFGDILDFTKRNLGQVIVAVLLAWVASLIGSLVGTLLCGVGLLLTGFWAFLVESHLYGQVGLEQSETPPTPEITPA